MRHPLVVIAILALLLGGFFMFLQRGDDRENRALPEDDGESWYRERLGEQIANIRAGKVLGYTDSAADDDSLAEIGQLTQVEYVDVSNSGVSDAGLKELVRLPRLKALELTSTEITDEGLAVLARMPQLA